MVRCYACKTYKRQDEFSPSCLKKAKHRICKKCSLEKRIIRKRNINYLINNAWHHQLRAKNRAPVRYSFEEFSEWVTNNELFIKLYRIWVESMCSLALTPTIIRIDSERDFYFDNLTVVTSKQAKDINIHKRDRMIIQLDKNGNEVARYQNARMAVTFVPVKSYSNIHQVCKGDKKTAGGFKWKYAE